jgi:arabinofuranosyltransferase
MGGMATLTASTTHLRNWRTLVSTAWRVAPWLTLALPPLLLLFSATGIIDDAYISGRYAWQFAHGHGLVFNPGQRVEGYSNLLWTVLLALPLRLGLPFAPVAFAGGLAGGLLALWQVRRIAQSLALPDWATSVAMLALALCVPFWLAATNGLEGGLYAALVTGTVADAFSGRAFRAGLWGSLAALTRPEGALLVPLCAGYALLSGQRRAARALLAPWLLTVAALTIWRVAYYGALVPNTITAKAGPHDPLHLAVTVLLGLQYWEGFLVATPGLVAGALLALLLAPRCHTIWLPLAILAAQLPTTLLNGGDWMPHVRLLIVFAPLLAPLAVLALVRLVTGPGPRLGRAALAALVGVGLVAPLITNAWQPTPAVRLTPQIACTDYVMLSDRLAPLLAPTDLIAPDALGYMSYTLMQQPSFDLLGLTDRTVARAGTVPILHYGTLAPVYTLIVQPALIISHGPANGALRYIAAADPPRYAALYQTYVIPGASLCPWRADDSLIAIRRDRLTALMPALAGLGARPLPLP